MSAESVDRSALSRQEETPYGASRTGSSFAGAVAVIGALYAAYFEFRYNGLWIENDTSVFTGTTTAMLRAGSVLFPGQYSHGFGYPAWLGVLSLETGLSPAVVNGLVAPFFGMTFALLTAYLLYRRLLRSEAATAVAAMLLFLVPDLMFTLLRGNHEKLNVPFIMLAVYSLLWFVDAERRGDFKSTITSTILYYVSIYMNGVTNDYFGVFMVVAGLLTAAMLTLFGRRIVGGGESRDYIRRFRTTAMVSALLMLWVMVFLFPQSAGDTTLMQTLLTKLKDLFVTQLAADNPYAIASSQWVTAGVNEVFATFHWALILLSGVSLLFIVAAVLRRRVRVRSEEFVLFCVYLAFMALVAAAVPVDLVGLSAGTNLELRNYTYFSLFAPPVTVIALGIVRSRLGSRLRGVLVTGVLALVYGVMFILAVPKSTVEPVSSTLWMGYTADERAALTAFEQNARSTAMWVGGDNRLVYLYGALFPDSRSRDVVVGYSPAKSPFITDVLVSPMVTGSALANRVALPDVHLMNRIFDNGGAQIYAPPFSSPFQY